MATLKELMESGITKLVTADIAAAEKAAEKSGEAPLSDEQKLELRKTRRKSLDATLDRLGNMIARGSPRIKHPEKEAGALSLALGEGTKETGGYNPTEAFAVGYVLGFRGQELAEFQKAAQADYKDREPVANSLSGDALRAVDLTENRVQELLDMINAAIEYEQRFGHPLTPKPRPKKATASPAAEPDAGEEQEAAASPAVDETSAAAPSPQVSLGAPRLRNAAAWRKQSGAERG